MSPACANTTLGCVARSRRTTVASRAIPPRRPSSTGSSTYVSLICSSVISTACDAAGACSLAAHPAKTPAARHHAAGRTRRLTLRDAGQPGMIATAREPLGQVAAGALGVAGAEARFEECVVEDVALRAAASQLDDTGPERLDLRDRRRVLALGERVQPLDERHGHIPHQPRRIFGPPPAHGVRTRLGPRAV